MSGRQNVPIGNNAAATVDFVASQNNGRHPWIFVRFRFVSADNALADRQTGFPAFCVWGASNIDIGPFGISPAGTYTFYLRQFSEFLVTAF